MKFDAPLICLVLLHPSLSYGGPSAQDSNAVDTLIAGGKTPVPAPRGGGRRVNAGFLHRSSGDFDWSAGTMSTPSLVTIDLGENYPGIEDIGPANAYLDGFVRLDSGTAETGDTCNWGYQNASQFNGSLLSFHGGDGRRSEFNAGSGTEAGVLGGELGGNAPFIDIAYMNPWRDAWSFGWQGGLSFFITDAGGMLSTFAADGGRTDYGISYTDVFELGTVIAPQAPYAGSIQGPGPLLPNIPVSRTPMEAVIGGETVSQRSAMNRAVYTVRRIKSCRADEGTLHSMSTTTSAL